MLYDLKYFFKMEFSPFEIINYILTQKLYIYSNVLIQNKNELEIEEQ